jgi:hypothetical protein
MRYRPTQHAHPDRWLIVASAVLSVVLLLAGCGGGDSGGESEAAVASTDGDGSSGGDDTSGGGSASDTEQELIDWVQCMRDQGVDVPDPQVDADGNLTLGDGGPGLGGGGGGVDQEALQAASEVCGEIPPGAFGGDQPDQTEVQDRLLEFAQCMRDNGYDMPDPDFSGGEGLTSAFGDIDTNDPAFQDAAAACEDIFAGGFGGGGAGDSSGEG